MHMENMEAVNRKGRGWGLGVGRAGGRARGVGGEGGGAPVGRGWGDERVRRSGDVQDQKRQSVQTLKVSCTPADTD